MKELTLVLLTSIFVCCTGFLIKVPTSPVKAVTGSRGWVHKQKMILPLFDNVCEDSKDPIIIRLAKEFTLDSADYTDPDVIIILKNLQYENKLLQKGEIFSEYNSDHLNELQSVYNLMYNAKDFDVFYKAAAWARQNINCGLFVNAVYLAIINRRDTSKITIPAPYELMPNYFIRKDIIVKGSTLLAGDDFIPTEPVKNEGNAYILYANYSTSVDDDENAKLAYFREDVGLNAYYFFRKLKLAPWLNNPTDMSNKYGEYLYQMMKQLAARYDLERYSNGLPELETINWDSQIKAYDPMLVYSNGYELCHRMYDDNLVDSSEMELIRGIENNIANVVVHMRQTGLNKSQILNHLMEIFVTGERSYEKLARRILGCNRVTENGQLSVLQHLMTSLRDPVFWKLNKKIVGMIDKVLEIIPSYSKNELYFPGVEILNVDTKKVMTQFDNFQFDVTDSLKSNMHNTSFQVRIAQTRLDRKSFVLKLNISSLVTQKGVIKVYLGPKTLPGELVVNKNLFVLLDTFEIQLKIGANIISRSSDEMSNFSDDFVPLSVLRKEVEDAEFGLNALPLKTIESQIGFPSRLILPKGTPGGLPLQIFIHIASFSKAVLIGSTSVLNSEFNSAILSPGFPLDLVIKDHQLFNLRNAFLKDISVTHKGNGKGYAGDGNKGTWSSDKSFDDSYKPDYSAKRNEYNKFDKPVEYDEDYSSFDFINHGLLNLRPEFTKRKEPANYQSKRDQYKKKTENITKTVMDDDRDKNTAFIHQFTKRPNYINKKNNSFDYSTNKIPYERKDYTSKRFDYKNKINQLDVASSEESANDLKRVNLERDVITNDNNPIEKYKIMPNGMNDEMNVGDEETNDFITKWDDNSTNPEPIEEPKRKPWTILDYLIRSFNHDSIEERVFE